MPCYHPIEGWRSREVNQATGKRSIVFNSRYAEDPDAALKIPCGQCMGCRLARSRQWAIRCVHEASLYQYNCFVTLTYDDAHLPVGGSLDVSVFQRFMKRLRKFVDEDFNDERGPQSTFGGPKIRFYHCGEYGERLGRPHYHACIFNLDFRDKLLWQVRGDVKLYRSAALESIWTDGFSSVGDVTFDSAAYVARYITKKMTGPDSDLSYVNFETGEIRNKEYTTMSRRPGIGREWFNRFSGDVFPDDFVVYKGKKFSVPKYYSSLFELADPEGFDNVKAQRDINMKRAAWNNTFERLAVREEFQADKMRLLRRGFENGS